MKTKLFNTICLLILSSLFTSVFALTRYVGVPSQSPNYTTIQAAINASAHGDLIQVANGIYLENIDFSGKNISIEPYGAATPTIQGIGGASVVTMRNLTGARLEGFIITKGTGTPNLGPWGTSGLFGGGVFMTTCQNSTLRRLTIKDCTADFGGGISIFSSADAVMQRINIDNCRALAGGGLSVISNSRYTVTLSNALITNCNGSVFGGGIEWNYSTNGTIEYTTIANCTGGYAAAIKRGNAARFDAKNCIFWGNTPALNQLNWDGGSPTTPSTVSYSIVQASNNPAFAGSNPDLTLANCLDVHPNFVSSTDFHLASGSPAINSGTTAVATDDLEGTMRPIDCVNDMGCYEMVRKPIELTRCAGDTSYLQAPQGSSYNWSSGESTQTIRIITNAPTTYTVKVTNQQGCTYNVIYNIKMNPAPKASISGVMKVCLGKTTTLTASGGLTYNWSNGAKVAAITVGVGTYTVTVTDANGCKSTTTATVIATPTIVIGIKKLNIVCSGETNIVSIYPSIKGGAAPFTYRWSNGATTPNLVNVASKTSSYCVTVTDAVGCQSIRCFTCMSPCSGNSAGVTAGENDDSSDTNQTHQIVPDTKKDLSEFTLQSHPNPAQQKVYINYTLPTGTELIAPAILVFDILGREIKNFPLTSQTGVIEISIDFPVGNYIYQIRDKTGEVWMSKKMVISN